MRAGKLTHVIELQRSTVTVNDAGTPAPTWSKVATLRAERIEQATTEILRNAGDTQDTVVVFRVHFLSGVTGTDRVLFDGEAFDLERVVVLGRNRGLELTCRRAEP